MSAVWAGIVLAAASFYKAASISSAETETLMRLAAEIWPPGPYLIGNLLDVSDALFLTGLTLFVHDAAGTRLLSFLPGGLRTSAALVSYLVLSYLILGLSACGLAQPAALAIPPAALLAFAWPRLGPCAREWRAAIGEAWRGIPFPARILTGAALLWCAPLLLPPESSVDGLVYHLTFPQQLLAANRLFGTDVLSHWAFPFVCELPYVYPLLLGLDPAARLTGLAFGLLGAVSFLRSIGVRGSPAAAAGIACAGFLAPASAWTAMITKNDVVVCACALAASGSLLESGVFASAFGKAKLRRPAAFLAASLLLGACFTMKYVTLPVVAALGLAAVLSLRAGGRPRACALLLAGLLVPFLPWAVKSWLYLNDPVYPLGTVFAPALFGDPAFNDMTREMFEIELREFRPRPWVFRDMVQLVCANSAGFVAGLPVLAAARASAFRPALPLLGALLVGLAGQLTFARVELEQVERYAYAVFVALNVCGISAVLGACRAGSGGPFRRQAFPAVCAWALALTCLARLYPTQEDRHATAYLSGKIGCLEYRRGNMFGYGSLLPEILEKTAAGPRARPAPVLSVGEILFCDLKSRALSGMLETPFVWRAAHEAGTVDRLAVKFRQTGARWMIYNSYLAGRWRYQYSPYQWDERMLGIYDSFARRFLSLQAFCGLMHPFYGSTWLYAIGERAKPATEMPFLPGVEASYAFAGLAHMNRAFGEAGSRFADMRVHLPGIIQLASLEGSALLDAGDPEGAYRLLARAARAGYVDEDNYLDLAAAAALSGRPEEARAALARARDLYPYWQDRLAEAREIVAGRPASGRTIDRP